MLIILGLLTPQLLTLPVFYALFDSHRGNVNNFGAPNPIIINITSVFLHLLIPTGEMLIILGLAPEVLTLPAF